MEGKYSVLLLREDRQVRSFHIHPVWFKLIILLFLFLAALASLGAYLGYEYWLKNSELQRQALVLERMVQERDVKLASLQNLEQVLALHDPDKVHRLLQRVTEEQVDASAPLVDLRELFRQSPSEDVAVKDVSLAPLQDGGVQLEFVLANEQKGETTLTGYTEVALVSNEGRLYDVTLPLQDASFNIQRFRTMTLTFPLPEQRGLSDFYALRLVLVAKEGQEVFTRAFPVSSLLPS